MNPLFISHETDDGWRRLRYADYSPELPGGSIPMVLVGRAASGEASDPAAR